MTTQNPQNPYGSYAVCASAGCGKTYQLARRFLFLVGAGASPANILTITFTKKAAAEMRERILMMTAQLLARREQCKIFEEELAKFHEAAAASPMPFGTYRFCPPRSGETTAREILAATQLLKITTIDSVFLDWYQKFPWEAGIGRDQAQKIRPQHVDILSTADAARINQTAWELTFAELLAARQLAGVKALAAPIGVLQLASRVTELMGHGSYLWLAREISRDRTDASLVLRRFAVDGVENLPRDEADLLRLLADDLMTLSPLLSPEKSDAVHTALACGALAPLREGGVLNADMIFSGNALRGKKREANLAVISRIDGALSLFNDAQKIAALTATGVDLVSLYARLSWHRDQLKAAAGFMEFDDTAQGCFTLFTAPEAAGARFLIHKNVHHLLLDEFQDTSLMQWSLFSTLAREMLAGAGLMPPLGGPLPSLFIVGDDKQSIYGFREADPSILTNARDTIEPLGASSVPLNDSYRSAGIILDFVCRHFAARLDNFPHHAPAKIAGEPIIPDHGMVVVVPPFSHPQEDDDQKEARQLEAAHVAALLKDAIHGEKPHLVYDKKVRGFRPLKQGDCAILYRAATHALVYEKALHAVGLKGRLMEGRGFFKRVETTDLMALVRWLAFPIDLVSLATLLKSPLGGMTDGQMLALMRRSQTKERQSLSRTAYLLDLLAGEHPELSLRLSTALKAVYQRPAGQLIVEIIGLWGAFARYRAALPAREHALVCANIQRFGEICVKLQGEGIRGIHALCARLSSMMDNEDLSNASLNDDTIALMTVHKAKGLEFPLVALVDAAQSWTKTDRYWVKAPFEDDAQGIYYIGTKEDQPKNHADFLRVVALNKKSVKEENLRLLYVALTRAGQYLYVTGALNAKSGHSGDDDGFLAGLMESAQALGAEETMLHGYQALVVRRDDVKAMGTSGEPCAAQSVPTASEPGSWFLPCPAAAGTLHTMHGEIEVLRPHRLLKRAEEDDNPKGGAGAQLRGTLIHRALEAFVRGESSDVPALCRALMGPGQDPLSQDTCAEIERVVACPTFRSLFADAQQIWTEQPFVHLDGGMLVRGTMDLVVKRGPPDVYWIVDYKTTPITAGQTAHELALLCAARGYSAQLEAYVRALRAIYPAAEVRGMVYFTATGQVVNGDTHLQGIGK